MFELRHPKNRGESEGRARGGGAEGSKVKELTQQARPPEFDFPKLCKKPAVMVHICNPSTPRGIWKLTNRPACFIYWQTQERPCFTYKGERQGPVPESCPQTFTCAS